MKNLKKYILFDNDGILVETEKWYFEANRKALSLLGLNLEIDFYHNILINNQNFSKNHSKKENCSSI